MSTYTFLKNVSLLAMQKTFTNRAIIIANLSATKRIELKCGSREILLGRSSECDLIMEDKSISRKHTRIIKTESGILVEDLSVNGTFVEGKKISKEVFTSDTQITIGPYDVQLKILPPESKKEDEDSTWVSAKKSTALGAEEDVSLSPEREISFPGQVGIVGESQALKWIFDLMLKISTTDIPVIVTGETGSGKEVVARGIHMMSERSGGAFVAINCAAISPNLVESEIFGHEKGAFTGAISRRLGAFELADEGTMLLDEVGEMPLEIQSKLLRAIELFEIRRVGGSKPIKIDSRIIATTNKNLEEEVTNKNFREDLYYRLNSCHIHIPPLRDRVEDIKPLTIYFLSEFNKKYDCKKEISNEALAFLKTYPWPGNVRQLKNTINFAATLVREGRISSSVLKKILTAQSMHKEDSKAEVPADNLKKMEEVEKEAIVTELRKTSWNKTRAAKNLGISKTTLFKKIRKYKIEPD